MSQYILYITSQILAILIHLVSVIPSLINCHVVFSLDDLFSKQLKYYKHLLIIDAINLSQ